MFVLFFFFKQKTAYEMRISDWSSDVCSSDLISMLTQKIHDMDGDSRTQNNREHYATLEKRIHKLQRERESLHQELEIAKLRSEERRVGKECVSTCRSG